MLITFSVPINLSLYFLYTEEANGVRFGMWGWCLDEYGICSTPLQLGYIWEPQIPNSITKALVLYPISAVFVILTMISLIPVAFSRTRSAKTDRIFFVFAWISFAFSTMAFLFMIAMWAVAKHRFEKRGFSASYGPLPWLSLTATLLLLAVALSPFILGPPPKPKQQRGLRRVTKRITELTEDDPEALNPSRRKNPQHSRHIKNLPSS